MVLKRVKRRSSPIRLRTRSRKDGEMAYRRHLSVSSRRSYLGPRREPPVECHKKGSFMQSLKHQSVLIVGGSRGLGLGVVEALAAHDANVTVIARDAARPTDLKARLGVSVIAGDATDPSLAESAIREVRPSALVLNAGATPVTSPLHKPTWESFSSNSETDVKATSHWIQAALKVPLPRGSRILIPSTGAPTPASPLSETYP